MSVTLKEIPVALLTMADRVDERINKTLGQMENGI